MKLLFYYPKTLVGKLIKLFSPIVLGKKVKYSHVGIKLDDYHVLDINGGKSSQIRHISANESDFDVVEIDLSYDQQTELYKSITNYLGLDYDYLKAIDVYNNDKKYTCYELVNLILYDTGYLDRMYNIDLPEDLIEIIKEVEDEFKRYNSSKQRKVR